MRGLALEDTTSLPLAGPILATGHRSITLLPITTSGRPPPLRDPLRVGPCPLPFDSSRREASTMRSPRVLLAILLLIPAASPADDRKAVEKPFGLERRTPLQRLPRRRLARPALPLQGRASLPQADHQATPDHDPRAGDRPPLHPPAPRTLGGAGPPARRPGRSGGDRGRDPARDRRPRRRPGLPPRLRTQRLRLHRPERPDEGPKKTTQVVRYTVDRRPPHRHRPEVQARHHRVALQRPQRRRPRLRQRRHSLRLLGRRDQRLRHRPDRPVPRRPAGGRAPDRRRPPRPGPELRGPEGQPVRRPPRRPSRVVGLRPAQPLAGQLRPRVGPALGRPERAGPLGAGLPGPEGGELRLERHRGEPRLPRPEQGGPRPDPPADRRAPPQRGPLAHRRSGLPRHPPARPGRGLRLRRLVHRPGLGDQARRQEGPLASRAGRHPLQHHRLRHRPRRRDVRHRPGDRILSLRADDRGRPALPAVPDPAERDGPVRLGRRLTSPTRPRSPST